MRIKPINNYISARLLEKNSTAVIKMSELEERPNRWAKVTGVGPGTIEMTGELVPVPISVDDTVFIMAHGQERLSEYGFNNDDNHIIASEFDVMCILNKDFTIQPLGNLIEIEKFATKEKSSVGLLLPESMRSHPCVGKVKSVGSGWKTIMGKDVPFHVKVGDVIVFKPHNTMIVDLENVGVNEIKYLISQNDILGIVEDYETT